MVVDLSHVAPVRLVMSKLGGNGVAKSSRNRPSNADTVKYRSGGVISDSNIISTGDLLTVVAVDVDFVVGAAVVVVVVVVVLVLPAALADGSACLF